MEENITFSTRSEGGDILSMVKNRKNRPVTTFLPPPGGPHALTSTVSTILLQNSFFLSHMPPYGLQCSTVSMTRRKSSIGGWAPYSSRAGIFTSSTKQINFFPTGGPTTPFLLLSSFISIISCVLLLEVCAEKLMVNGARLSGSTNLLSESAIMTDLPVPVSPTNKQPRFTSIRAPKMKLYLVVSLVGTRISEKFTALSNLKPSVMSSHGRKSFDSLS
mmetsp:Transcript_37027/g.77344  ORF Transcript_37027/g.77344 Transcript_37027/m.77344 type:complete len:218 (+) Transcript_37027:6008-6661(+)